MARGQTIPHQRCGYAPDAEVNECVFVSHPSADLIVWHLDWLQYRHHINSALTENGSGLVLHFQRSEYEADLRAMWHEVAAAKTVLPIELKPLDVDGLDRLQVSMDGAMPMQPEPVLPPGSILEFGFSGRECIRVNSQPVFWWPPHLLPDGRTHDAFDAWIAFVKRGFSLSPELTPSNDFFLLREEDREACNEAGFHLVACLREAWAASVPPQSVDVRYRPCDIAAAPK